MKDKSEMIVLQMTDGTDTKAMVSVTERALVIEHLSFFGLVFKIDKTSARQVLTRLQELVGKE